MRVESGVMPASYQVKVVGEQAFVEFAENVTGPFPTKDGEKYLYDYYVLEVRNSPTLEQRVFENYETWIARARQAENEPKPQTLDQRVSNTETKVVTIEETIDVLFGGAN